MAYKEPTHITRKSCTNDYMIFLAIITLSTTFYLVEY